jgi:hypothetical protein
MIHQHCQSAPLVLSCRRSGNDDVMQLSGLPDLSLTWLNRALGSSTASGTAGGTAGGPGLDGDFAALQMVVGCFPSVSPGSAASASSTERKLLLELMRCHMTHNGNVAHGVGEQDSAQNNTSAAMQLAVAAISYCWTDLQPQVRNQALMIRAPSAGDASEKHLSGGCRTLSLALAEPRLAWLRHAPSGKISPIHLRRR